MGLRNFFGQIRNPVKIAVMKTLSRKKRGTAVLGPVPEIISRIPRSYPPSPEQLGTLIDIELGDIWIKILPEAERDQFHWPDAVSPNALEKLDALILRQAETMGWRMGLSQFVHWRFDQWDVKPNGPELFEQYGRAFATSARRFQKTKPPPIDDPNLHLFKKENVHEIRQLRRALKKEFCKKRIAPTSDQLIDLFQKTVSVEGDAFAHLKRNVKSWITFLRENSEATEPLLLGKRASPAALFDFWFWVE